MLIVAGALNRANRVHFFIPIFDIFFIVVAMCDLVHDVGTIHVFHLVDCS